MLTQEQIDRLPKREKIAVQMSNLGCSISRIAREMQIGETTVKAYISTAHKRSAQQTFAPSTEREVWIETNWEQNAQILVYPHKSDDDAKIVVCPRKFDTYYNTLDDDTISHKYTLACWCDCAAFRRENGFAKCQMMNGEQIIGKFIEKE